MSEGTYTPGSPYGSGHRVTHGVITGGQVLIFVKRRVGWPYPDDGPHPVDSYYDQTPFEVIHTETVNATALRDRLSGLRSQYCRVVSRNDGVTYTKGKSTPIPTQQPRDTQPAPGQGNLFG